MGTKRLANALIRNGFGKCIEECLKRVKPLPKTTTSLAENRPNAAQHYDSIEVQTILSEPNELLLVDDIVTCGATMLGIANKLQDTTIFDRDHIVLSLQSRLCLDALISESEISVLRHRIIAIMYYNQFRVGTYKEIQ